MTRNSPLPRFSPVRSLIPVFLLLVTSLVIGTLIVNDYGESWDEYLRYQYAGKEIAAYTRKINPANDEKGPAYVMLARLGADRLQRVFPGWGVMPAWHWLNFLSFEFGVLALYLICRRFLFPWSAFTVVGLFATQPLLWGHAFINPKDIPFMSFFTASVAFGLRMVDSFGKALAPARSRSSQGREAAPGLVTWISMDWWVIGMKTRRALIGFGAITLGLVLGMIVFHALILDLIQGIIRQAYAANPHSWLGSLFSRLAASSNTIPVDLYIQKALRLYRRFQWLYIILSLVINLGLAVRFFPRAARWVWWRWIGPGMHWARSTLLNGNLWLAGLLLGLTTSIRVLGPAAGLLVAGYFFLKHRWKSLPVLAAYFLLACLVAYATWPDLWGAPLAKFVQDLTHSTDFSLDGTVTFAGMQYEESALPRRYLPALLSFQFTEPVEILFVFGLGVAAYKAYRGSLDRRMLALAAAWFFIPVLTTIGLRLNMYDNFRHFLFVIPAFFLFVGVGLQAIFDKIGRFALAGLLSCLLILPGIYWDVALHPYQYVYYNSFIGGLRGAFRDYEMDYWAVSYHEAALYLNRNAPAGARVIVWGPDQIVKHAARPDLAIEKYQDGASYTISSPSYAVVLTRRNKDLELFPQTEVVFQVSRFGAVFSVVKRLDASTVAGLAR